MRTIKLREDRIKRLIKLGAPDALIENERKRLQEIYGRIDLAIEIEKKLRDICNITKLIKLESEDAKKFGKTSGFLIICDYKQEQPSKYQIGMNIFILLESNIIQMISAVKPSFDERVALPILFKNLNKWNSNTPMMKFYMVENQVRVSTEFVLDGTNQIDPILKRFHQLAFETKYISEQVQFINALQEVDLREIE